MSDHFRIVRDSAICVGQTAVRGTWVLVRDILGCLADGMGIDILRHEFRPLTEAELRAVSALPRAVAAEDLAAALLVPSEIKAAGAAAPPLGYA